MFSNRTEITLISELGTLILDDDPIGYDQSETEIGRSEKTFGIFLKEINNLEFTGQVKSWLETLYALKGVKAKCQLIKKEKHPTTDEWVLRSSGRLDFLTRKIKDGKLQLSFIEGGLREVVVSQIREKFELNRTTDINGKMISELKTDVLSHKGRDLYLVSRFTERDTEFTTKSGRWKSINEDRESFHPFPLFPAANTDDLNIQTPYESYKGEERYDQSIVNMFFATADRNKGRTLFRGSASFKVSARDANRANEYNFKFVVFRYTSDEDGSNLSRDVTPVFEQNLGGLPDVGTEFTVNLPEITLNPLKNESYAMGLYSVGQYGGPLAPPTFDGWVNITFSDFKASFTWAEDSFYKRTNSPCLTAYNAGKRLSEILTGSENFESNLLDGTDNTFLTDNNHELLFAPGGWIRNLKKKDDNDAELPWPMEISFDEYYNSINAILPVGYGIATYGNFQKIVFEDLRFFFQRTVMGNLGKIQIKGRDTAVEYCYGPLKFGYTKGGEYEKPLGLDEFNTQTDSRSPLTNEGLTTYDVLGPSRADSYAVEDARRMQAADFPDEDTTYDKDNFMFDAKFITRSNFTNYYEPRLWADDFEIIPTGIYSPETAFNLNLSPARNRKRHEYFWSSAITMLQDEEIQFTNAKGNSQLKTKKLGEDVVQERANVPISKLQKPIFKPEWIEAESPFDQKIMDQILGSTNIDGRMVNNYYGLWEFINEKNRIEYAYLFSVKSKDKLTYKLLSAYGI